MIQTSAIRQGNKQLANKAIRSPQGNVPQAELSGLHRYINALCLRPAKSPGPLAIITGAAVIGITIALHALSASAQTARDVKGATPLVAIQDEAPVTTHRRPTDSRTAGSGTRLYSVSD